jgi:hypothetical protein
MKGVLKIVAFGLGGLALALALSLGAIAIAGRSLGEPPRPLQVPSTDQAHLTSPGAIRTPKPSGGDDHGGQSPSASSDDHGQSPSASPSDDGGIDDSGGSGGSGTDDHGGDD